MVEHDPEAPAALELGVEGARQVQLAVYADKSSRRRVSKRLHHAREQASRYLETLQGRATRT
jgi:hypothetical protein